MELDIIANNIRKLALTYIHAAGSGHPGGSLSVADILACLYFKVAQPQPYTPDDPDRDIIILDKGHACPALYAAWQVLIDNGHPKPEWWGEGPITLRKPGSAFQGHPSLRHTPWCETSTGSLGQGFAVAVGMSLASRERRVYVVLGDGGMQEGIVAEAARLAGWYSLDNLTAIVDWNGLASDQYSQQVRSIVGEFDAWGWYTLTCDGHNIPELLSTFELAGRSRMRPTCIIARTNKGQGWERAERDPAGMHGSVTLSDKDLAEALDGLDRETTT